MEAISNNWIVNERVRIIMPQVLLQELRYRAKYIKLFHRGFHCRCVCPERWEALAYHLDGNAPKVRNLSEQFLFSARLFLERT